MGRVLRLSLKTDLYSRHHVKKSSHTVVMGRGLEVMHYFIW